MWRELNKLYWQLSRPGVSPRRGQESPHDFYQAVETGSQLFQGVCDATLTHDEGWQFIQLGKYLERADKTLRHPGRASTTQLQQLADAGRPVAGEPAVGARAAKLPGLRGVSAALHQPRRAGAGGRVPAAQSRVPALGAVLPGAGRGRRWLRSSGQPLEPGDSPSARLLGRIVSDLQFRDLDDLLRVGPARRSSSSRSQRCVAGEHGHSAKQYCVADS